MSTEVSQMHKYVTCSTLYFLFCFLFFFSSRTAKLSQLCQSFTVCIQKNLWILPAVQRSTSSVLCVYWSKQNESQDGRVEVSCDQLRWYLSTESVQHENIFFFFFKVWTWSTVVSPFHPPTPPAAVQMQSFTPAGGESEMWGRAEWNGEPVLVFMMRKRERDRERKREKLRPSVFFPPPCHTVTRRAAALLIGEQEEREGAGSTDQGSAAISQCFDQWSGAVSGSSPLSPLCLPQFLHPTPDISPLLIAAGPVDRGGPPWPSTVRGWCSSGTDAGHLHVQREGVSRGQSRHGLWSLEGGPVCGRDVLIQKTKNVQTPPK